jgi:hypothetical protein
VNLCEVGEFNPPCDCTGDAREEVEQVFLTSTENVADTVCDSDVRRLIVNEVIDVTDSLPTGTCEGSPLIQKSWNGLTADLYTCEGGPPPPTNPPPAIWTVIFANDFESGLENFEDSGSDAKLYSSARGKYSHSGFQSLALRDDTGTSLSVTNPFAVSSFSTLKVEFWYKSKGFNQESDGFFLQSADGHDGTDWVTKGSWSYQANGFTRNNRWRFASVKFQIDTTTMRIRFKNDGDNNQEKIFIDDVIVSGI